MKKISMSLTLILSILFLVSCEQKEVIESMENAPVTQTDETTQPDPTQEELSIAKPYGVFSSKTDTTQTNNPIVTHEHSKGVLLRTSWNSIEPVEGIFNFNYLDSEIQLIKNNLREKEDFSYSLAISAGCSTGTDGYPRWMDSKPEIEKIQIKFRDVTCSNMPKGWGDNYLAKLKILAEKINEKYGNDERLKLVYVPQATGNGVEGHFNGNTGSNPNDWTPLTSQGLNAETWGKAMKEASIIFAEALPSKAIAIEVHKVIGSHDIPLKAINDLFEDPRAGKRIGAAMWWLFGNDYEIELAEGLANFPGDLYGQIGANSTQLTRLGGCEYVSTFDMAIELGMRYIEPWDKEFKQGGTFGVDSNTYEAQSRNFQKFNQYTYEKYVLGQKPVKPIFETLPTPEKIDPAHDPSKKSCPSKYDDV